jgi:ElaB/YqjD/DUF883 family membrane-anchored ribosome-binding protein
LKEQLIPNDERSGIFDRVAEVMPQLNGLLGTLGSSFDAPSEPALVKFDKVKARLNTLLEQVNKLMESDVKAYKQQVEAAGFTVFGKMDAVKMKE